MDRQRLFELAGIDKKEGLTVRLEIETEKNGNFRKVLFTGSHMQLVLMSLKPEQEIGMETHNGDQFIRVDKGAAIAILDGVESTLEDGDAVVIPKGVKHNIINKSDSNDLKIYAIYSPPEHPDGTVVKEKP